MSTPIDPKKDPARRVLKFTAWPDLDQRAWRAAIQSGDPLDPGGAGAHWAPQTQHAAAKAYGRWLEWLDRQGCLEHDRSPVDRVTPEIVARYVAELRSMIALSTLITYITYLEFAVHAMAPEHSLGWIRQIVLRLKRTPAPAHTKRHRLVPSDELFAYGLKLMEQCERPSNATAEQRARCYRDGLMLAFLAARPLRRGNFASIEMGRHLVQRADGYWLCFEANEMKNRIAFEIPLPTSLAPYLARYLSQHRPVLCKGSDLFRGSRLHPPGDRLWVTNMHSAMSPGSVYGRIMAITKEAFGHAIHPHLFRDSAATSIACADPMHVYVTKSVLGHTTLRTSEKYYNHAQSLQATQHYQARVHELREQVQPRHDRVVRQRFMKG